MKGDYDFNTHNNVIRHVNSRYSGSHYSVLAPNMVFCVDVGVYHEEWGIGFRLEDNCLVTETGCENLSAGIPRTIADIEAEIGRI